jgi:hypothetical protein
MMVLIIVSAIRQKYVRQKNKRLFFCLTYFCLINLEGKDK